jgi:hypothetical protein
MADAIEAPIGRRGGERRGETGRGGEVGKGKRTPCGRVEQPMVEWKEPEGREFL